MSSGIRLCNIDIKKHRSLRAGDSLKDCVVAWDGDAAFSYTHANGVWQYIPEFWHRVWDADGYRYFDVSPVAVPGYTHEPEGIEGRWFGGTHTLSVDYENKTCLVPKPGMPAKSIAMSTLHTYAKNFGGTLEDIYSYSAKNILMIVEFATMNMQTAVGSGVASLYRQNSDTIQAAATASATVKVLKANAAMCIPGAIFDIGTSNGGAQVGSFIIGSVVDDPNDATLSVVSLLTGDGATPASVTVTTAHMWSIHGLANIADEDIGKDSGYIGADGKCNAYYRGQVAHANLWRYVLGAYRQTVTGRIWVARSREEADAHDSLNTTVHEDTGIALPQAAGGAAGGGYIQSLGLFDKLGGAPFCTEIGGNSANPVGDYCYSPALSTVNTILVAGGAAGNGSYAGRFHGAWNNPALSASWDYAAVPRLKTPTPINGTYDGVDLSAVFPSAAAFRAAVAAGDFSKIKVGDYWSITLTGSYRDVSSYTVPAGTTYYSDAALTTSVGTTSAALEGLYQSATAVKVRIGGTDYYVAVGDCLPYFVRTLSNALMKMEVGSINPYINYGDTPISSNHLIMISRDCLPHPLKMRVANTVWYDNTATNPWLGSALYETLNNEEHGILSLVAATDIGAYIHAGPNNKGMRIIVEKKAAGVVSPTGYEFADRGKLFVPSEYEVFGRYMRSVQGIGTGEFIRQYIFQDSYRHAVKGVGAGGSRCIWLCSSSVDGSAIAFCGMDNLGCSCVNAAGSPRGIPICFLIS